MIQYFVKDYTGAPFELFGPAHLLALGIVLLINLAIPLLKPRLTPRARKWIRYILAFILVANETAWHLWNALTGQWTLQTMLPLHLCSVLVWTSAYMLLTKSYTIYEFLYFLGIGGALQALLTPDAGIYGFPHFRAFQTMISHGTIITAAIYMTVVEGYRPTWQSVKRVAIWGNVYMASIFIINQLIGSNYMFIAHKPATASLIDVLGPWPWYILSLEAIAFIMFLILYSPYIIYDWRQRARSTH
jgi:hypothetical integral membrane protein (TIGR02206 family)